MSVEINLQSLTLNVQTVGITKVTDGKINFSLYPNPSRNEIVFENKSEDATMQHISIFNVLGSVVYERNSDVNKMQVLNVSKLASGIYTVRILTNKGLAIKKFEVVR